MRQPLSWDQFARQLAEKHARQAQSSYCVECGKPIVLIRAHTAYEQAVRSRQLATGLCWECAGGSLE